MMKTTRTRTKVGFALSCLLIFLIGMSSNLSTTQLIGNSKEITHTFEVLNQLSSLSTLFVSAQNDLRGFQITEQDYYLTRFYEIKKDFPVQISSIRELTKDNPIQQKTLSHLDDLLKAKMQSWDDFVQQRPKKGFEFYQDKMRGTEGKIQNSEIDHQIELLRQEELSLLNYRTDKTNSTAKITLTVVTLGGILALLFLGAAAYMVNRDIRRREVAEKELDLFFVSSLDMLCISGMDGYFKKISPAFEKTLGYSLEELYARPILDFIHPDDLQPTLDEINKQAGGEIVMSFENRYRAKDGSYKVFSWKSVPVGERMYAVARDVTQQKDFERELVEAKELSQAAAKAKAEFLANMSHEIRTPLNGIIGVTDLLVDTPLNDEQKKFVDIIHDSGSGLLKIINEILDFSKIEAGKIELEILDFDFAQLIQNQTSLVSHRVNERKLRLSTLIDAKIPPRLRGDSGRISQVLLNFLSNAIKFTDVGEITVRTELKTLDKYNCVVKFSVQDSGIGLSQDQIKKLFSPFVQGDGSMARKYGGTGLGLSICRRLTELMGGEIGVESTPSHGSTFWFTVRLQTATTEAAPILNNSISKPAKKALRILVAEDNFVNQMIIMEMLKKLGHSALLVANGLEAVDAFSKGQFDLVLMDHHMPEMDGMQATQLIRGKEDLTVHSRTPILAFTANVLPEDQKRCLDAGMDDFIHKPVTLIVLENAINKFAANI